MAVNGTPVAGPEARRSGIDSFEEAIRVVREAAEVADPAGDLATPPRRVLTFKRTLGDGQQRNLPSPYHHLVPPDVVPAPNSPLGTRAGVNNESSAAISGARPSHSGGFHRSKGSFICTDK